MPDLTSPKLTKRQYFVVASLLFGLFFGAGNLIFPLHLGQLAGGHWVGAAAGFLVTGVLLPLLSVMVIAITRAEGVFDIGRPLGVVFALVFMVLIHATIGPLFGTPRTATVSFTVGVAPFVPAQYQQVALLIFSAVFFGLAFAFSYRENSILANVGKVLNPMFLVLLFLMFLVAFLRPLGNPMTTTATAAYVRGSVVNGFLQGYNTMDALAVLITVTCLTTAVGLVAAFAQDFHKHFPQLSYHAWLTLTTLASFVIANFGLQQIIAWSTPMLMFLYPLAMVLILLSVFSPCFNRDGVVYAFVVVTTIVPALGDMVVAFPSVVSASAFGQLVATWRDLLPLSGLGLSWVVPALIGLVLGLGVHAWRVRQAATSEVVD